MASEVAAAYVAIRGASEQLAADFGKARTIAITGIASLASEVGKAMAAVGDAIGRVLTAPLTIFSRLARVQLGSLVGDLGEVFGAVVADVGKLAGAAVRFVTSAASSAVSLAGTAVSGVLNLVGGIVNVVAKSVGGLVSLLVPVLGGLVGGLVSMAGGIVSGLVGAAGSILGSVASTIASVVGQVGAVLGALAEKVAGVVGAIVGKIAGVAGGVLDAVLGPALSGMGNNLFDFSRWTRSAMEFETAEARLAQTLRNTGEAAGWSASQLQTMARNMAQVTTTSYEETRAIQGMLLQFRSIRGDQFADVIRVSRDLADMMGIRTTEAARMLAQALQDPVAGMGQLRQAGIELTESQRIAIQRMRDMNNMAGAQQLALLAIRRSTEGMSEALENTTQGQVNRIRQTWDSIGESIGRALLPVARIFTEFLSPLVRGFAETITGFLGGVGQGSRSLAENAIAWIRANQETIVNWGRTVGNIVIGVVNFFRDAFTGIATWLANLFTSIAGNGGQAGTNIAGDITRALAIVETGVNNLGLVWDMMLTRLRLAWEQAKSFITALFDVIAAKAEEIWVRIVDTLGRELARVRRNITDVGGWFSSESRELRERNIAATGSSPTIFGEGVGGFGGIARGRGDNAWMNQRGRREGESLEDFRRAMGMPSPGQTPQAQQIATAANSDVQRATERTAAAIAALGQATAQETEQTRALRDQLTNQQQEFGRLVTQTQAQNAAAARAQQQRAISPTGAPTPDAMATRPAQEFVGLSELYRQITKQVAGADTANLMRQTAENTRTMAGTLASIDVNARRIADRQGGGAVLGAD